jgi:hypothetical protein
LILNTYTKGGGSAYQIPRAIPSEDPNLPTPDIRTGLNYNPNYLRGMDTSPIQPKMASVPTAILSNPIPKRVNADTGPNLTQTTKLNNSSDVGSGFAGLSTGQKAMASAPGILGLGLGIKQLFDSGNVKLEDTISQEDKDNFADQKLRAASAKVPDYALQQENKNIATTNAINEAKLGATSGDQVIQAALGAQRNANAFDRQLSSAGKNFQQDNINKRQQLAQYIAQQRKQDLINKQQKEAALYEAGVGNIMGGVSGLATLGMGI